RAGGDVPDSRAGANGKGEDHEPDDAPERCCAGRSPGAAGQGCAAGRGAGPPVGSTALQTARRQVSSSGWRQAIVSGGKTASATGGRSRDTRRSPSEGRPPVDVGQQF